MTRKQLAAAAAVVLASMAPAAAGAPAHPTAARAKKPVPQFRVLVFTKTVGAKLPSTAAGVTAIKALGAKNRFAVDTTANSRQFTTTNLRRYRSVVFLNTAGDVLNSAQRLAFKAYFRNGGGFVGVHAAIEAEPDWPFLTSLLGARATGETASQPGTVKVADRVHDATKALPEYWERTDRWYNFDTNVRGSSHVLATVVEAPWAAQPSGLTLNAIAGGTMGSDHPVAWCKDTAGGRSFYTAGGHDPAVFATTTFRSHLLGAIKWAAGRSSTTYSDCGATVLANYQMVAVASAPDLGEPMAFDVLPDGTGRVIQTDRTGSVRLHDPIASTTTVLADVPVYTNVEDGLYGPAVDNDFNTNHWVYLYYSPPTVTVEQSDGVTRTITTDPVGTAPTVGPTLATWDPWLGYFQLSRFKFVDATGATPAHLDLASEQKILQVPNDRGACCHNAGDIAFDSHNNLWLVTGDDTPSEGGGAGGFAPFNDQLTNEAQTVGVANATGGSFTLTFSGQTTSPIPFNAAAAATQSALEALSNIAPEAVVVTGGVVNAGNQTVSFRGAFAGLNQGQLTGDASGLTGVSPAVTIAITEEGGWFNAPHVDARRSALNTNDLRGKVLRIHVGSDGSYTSPAGNLFPSGTAKTRPEIYAMGFRNPFRIALDANDVAYVTDYGPDAEVPQPLRGPAGTGRVAVIREPSSYGWPLCSAPELPYYRWNFATLLPLDSPAVPYECDNPTHGPQNASRWNLTGGPMVEAGLEYGPPIARPEIWYSYRDNDAVSPLGTPCFAYYGPDAATNPTCPRLFPELFADGVGPHGAAPYDFNAANPNPTKFPPYYDGAFVLGEWTQDALREIRLDSQHRVFKINDVLNCGAAASATRPFLCNSPMDMRFGKDGRFYLLTYGDGLFTAGADAAMERFDYVKGTHSPVARLRASRTKGRTPLEVTFSSAGSKDLDLLDSIRFAWDFNGDGKIDSYDPRPTYRYAKSGTFTVRLTVTDSSGKQRQAKIRIRVRKP